MTSKQSYLFKGLSYILLLIAFSHLSPLSASKKDDIITDIILIDRQAELVDLNQKGDILRRHISVPDYWTSGQSHSYSLKKALLSIKAYGAVDAIDDAFISGSSSLPAECLQAFLRQKVSHFTFERLHLQDGLSKLNASPTSAFESPISSIVSYTIIASSKSHPQERSPHSSALIKSAISWQRHYAHIRFEDKRLLLYET